MTTRPNILFVFPDELRQQAMGFMNADPVVTPCLDAFARESMVLPNAVSNHPLCSPYRAMLLTGKYPLSNGVTTNCNSYGTRFGVYLKEDERCLSDVLHDSGYHTGYIGKWHLDPPDAPPAARWQEAVWDAYNPPGPRRHSFDMWHAYGCCNQHMHPYYYIGDAKEGEKTFFDQWSVEHETDVAIEYLKNADGTQRDPDKPFALFMSMNPPHMPFEQVPQKYVDVYEDKSPQELLNRPNISLDGVGERAVGDVKNYFAAVTGIDENIGRLLACLREQGLEDNTIVVFTADHGEMMGSNGRMYKNVWYDESFLVPFIIRWPGRIRPGRDSLHMAVPDLMPSLLAMAGLADRTPAGVEGSDHSGVLLGTSNGCPTSALYLWPDVEHGERGGRGVRTDRYTFVLTRMAGEDETILFDNQSDPYQTANVATDHPDVICDLTEELRNWLTKTHDPWLENQAGAG